jgi:protein-L-isoaspartate(D-aspartate) O-methyltransferase
MTRIWLAIGTLLAAAAAPLAQAQSRAEFERARNKLVDEILIPGGVKNERVVQAMRDTPRHEFVTASLRRQA